MFAISNNELNKKPTHKGKTIKCYKCGKNHKIRYGKSMYDGELRDDDFLGYYKCGKDMYLATIGGKAI